MRAMSHRRGRHLIPALVGFLAIFMGCSARCLPGPVQAPILAVGTAIAPLLTVGQMDVPTQFRILNASFNGPRGIRLHDRQLHHRSGRSEQHHAGAELRIAAGLGELSGCRRRPWRARAERHRSGAGRQRVRGRVVRDPADRHGAGQVYTFIPSAAFTLGPANGSGGPGANECIIDFTTDVLAAPTKDANAISVRASDRSEVLRGRCRHRTGAPRPARHGHGHDRDDDHDPAGHQHDGDQWHGRRDDL